MPNNENAPETTTNSSHSKLSRRTIDYTTFYDNISKYVSECDNGQLELSKLTGIATSTMSRYVQRERAPELEYVYRLAKWACVSMEHLLGLSFPMRDMPNPEGAEIGKLYSFASEDDKAVVQAVLKKYKKKLESDKWQ